MGCLASAHGAVSVLWGVCGGRGSALGCGAATCVGCTAVRWGAGQQGVRARAAGGRVVSRSGWGRELLVSRLHGLACKDI
ncbi:hypothetical protein HaLaN_25317 [Haematococcus lacustris]|uniref:Secreted protein n=1 Tax=Haematococcus lacustris TaxID=44745 RepID=A0A6A0A2F7_HAELA|nr:hypothetical protein HaLaN_25317 [Haematococcus lacustris]